MPQACHRLSSQLSVAEMGGFFLLPPGWAASLRGRGALYFLNTKPALVGKVDNHTHSREGTRHARVPSRPCSLSGIQGAPNCFLLHSVAFHGDAQGWSARVMGTKTTLGGPFGSPAVPLLQRNGGVLANDCQVTSLYGLL